MRNSAISAIMSVVGLICVFSLSGQTATVVSRPLRTDLRTSASRSAVLIELRSYPSDDARYRLYNGSTQYSCWDNTSGSFITATAYSSGPRVPGSPSTSSLFWIPFVRGNNNSTGATYRDRLGPAYTTNFRDVALPASDPFENADTISGTLAEGAGFNLNEKYILLAFSGSAIITASHSDIGEGAISLPFPKGVTLDKVEARRVDNTIVGVCEGSWSGTTAIGTITLGLISRTASETAGDIRIFPVPASEKILVEGTCLIMRAEIIDPRGRFISIPSLTNGLRPEIDISGLPPGIYFLRIDDGKGIKIFRFVKV